MTTAETSEPRDVLTQHEAQARAAQVGGCNYVLALDLHAGRETYSGDATIRFILTQSADTFLDFRGRSIQSLSVNGQTAAPDWSGYRLTLPGRLLGAGENTVRVVYENEYDHTGDGFHQFVDPEDGQEYLYSNFEPYEAHRLFPCFDQPDIKATYQLTVTAPAEWEVISNARQIEHTSAGRDRAIHRFEETKPFSTYLFAVVAGPYTVARERHNGIDLGLYCRKSLLKHLDTDELFTITRQGLDWFGEFFAFPYPFGKYDQLFVPEFNAGAMENVGAVTHNEYMIFRDPPTETQRRNRAETVLHEMAHMWFGDLVTMRWWNDLWLNESFASYMAYLCLDGATRFTNGWQDFAATMKEWAYRQDQLVTTHPIAGQVPDTDQTFLNFDGITYGKGAAVLKQLVARIGIEGFRDGMRQYFQRHQYSNATLAQFIGALESGSGQELSAWAAAWIETASLNTIGATWQADGERITELRLRQTAPADYPTLRPHTLEIGLLYDRGQAGAAAVEVEAVRAEISGAGAEVPAARGKARPDFVFPNYGDHAYTKVALDPRSVAWAQANLERIDDILLRQLVWSSLWNMVRDQQLKSTDFMAIVRAKLPLEPRIELTETVLRQASTALARFVPEPWKETETHAMFEAALAALGAAPHGDAQITWMRNLIGFAAVPSDIALLGQFADGTRSYPGLTVDQDMRWAIVAKYMAYGLPDAAERVEAQAARDPSDRGQRARLRAETAQPEAAVKELAWERFRRPEGYGSLYLTGAAMSGFNWSHQRNLLTPYVERFFEAAPHVFRGDEKEFATDFFTALFPAYRIEDEVLDRSERLLNETAIELPLLARKLREANDELQRAIRCRAFAQGEEPDR